MDSSSQNASAEPALKIPKLEKLLCQECNSECLANDTRKHILKTHMEVQLYKCPFCEFQTNNKQSLHLIRKHVNGAIVGLINQSDQYDKEIDLWTKRCFMSKTEKQPELFVNPSLENGEQLVTSSNESEQKCLGRKQGQSRVENLNQNEKFPTEGNYSCKNWLKVQELKCVKLKSSTEKFLTNPDFVQCQQCKAAIRKYREKQHIFTYHMKPEIQNSACEFASRTLRKMKNHISKSHKSEIDTVTIFKENARERNREAEEVLLKCFGKVRRKTEQMGRPKIALKVRKHKKRLIETKFGKTRSYCNNYSVDQKSDLLNRSRISRAPIENGVFCNLCKFSVAKNQRQSHVVRYHLKPRYTNSVCPFRAKFLYTMQKHLKRNHKNDLKNVKITARDGDEVKREVEEFFMKCFNERHKSKISALSSCSGWKTALENNNIPKEDQVQKLSDETSSDSDTIICRMCKISIKKIRKTDHIDLCHMAPRFSNSVCDFRSNSNAAVAVHVIQVHNIEPGNLEISKDSRNARAQEIRKMFETCFGTETAAKIKLNFFTPKRQKSRAHPSFCNNWELKLEKMENYAKLNLNSGKEVSNSEIICKLCGSMVKKLQMKTHIYVDHLTPTYSNSICRYRTNKKENLARHLSTKHPQSIENWDIFKKDTKDVIKEMRQLHFTCFGQSYNLVAGKLLKKSVRKLNPPGNFCNNWENRQKRTPHLRNGSSKSNSEILSKNQIICKLCSSIVEKSRKSNHIQIWHSNPVVSNSLCQYKSISKAHTIGHIWNVHQKSFETVEIFKKDTIEIVKELRELYTKCFDLQYRGSLRKAGENLTKKDGKKSRIIGSSLDSGKFQCRKCSSILHHRRSLKKHVMRHLEPLYFCTGCSYEVIEKSWLRLHVEKCAKNGKIGFKSDYFKEHFNRQYLECFPDIDKQDETQEISCISTSMTRISSNPQFQCSLCPNVVGLRFASRHAETAHSGENSGLDFKALLQRCFGENFVTSNHHLNAGKYTKCQLCFSEILAGSSSLRRHVRTAHIGKNLQKLKNETDEKSNEFDELFKECFPEFRKTPRSNQSNICQKCMQNGIVKRGRHVEKFHLNYKFSCNVCEFTNFTTSSLVQHMTRAHKIPTKLKDVRDKIPVEVRQKFAELLKECFPESLKSSSNAENELENSQILPESLIENSKSDIQLDACKKCKVLVGSERNLREIHIKSHHYLNYFACALCKKSNFTFENLDEHIKFEHGNIKQISTLCGFAPDYEKRIRQLIAECFG